jgi:truncated hemoglobin YjbI
MTIDERLQRLTERHEALTQSMELFQHDMAEMRAAAAERDAITDARINRLVGIVEKLADTAQNHEHRIERLEG